MRVSWHASIGNYNVTNRFCMQQKAIMTSSTCIASLWCASLTPLLLIRINECWHVSTATPSPSGTQARMIWLRYSYDTTG